MSEAGEVAGKTGAHIIADMIKPLAREAESVGEHEAADEGGRVAGLTVGDGSQRTLEEQLAEPHIHPDNAGIVGNDYDPYGGMGNAQEFRNRFFDETGGRGGSGEWRWPPDDGAVAGSRSIVKPEDVGPLDRIGGDYGSYFSPKDTGFASRSIPPDRLNFARRVFHLDVDSPALRNGDLRIERSDIAPAFGQPGGGVQYRFLDRDGNAVPTGALRDIWRVIKQ